MTYSAAKIQIISDSPHFLQRKFAERRGKGGKFLEMGDEESWKLGIAEHALSIHRANCVSLASVERLFSSVLSQQSLQFLMQ